MSKVLATAPRNASPSDVNLAVEDVPAFIAGAIEACRQDELIPLDTARGRVLRAGIVAPMALPPFDHAAVDGYALRQADLAALDVPIAIDGLVRAGDPSLGASRGATRILTGAPIAPDTAGVVMQEHVRRDGDAIFLSDRVRHGANICRHGEDVAPGEPVMAGGTKLDARHLALLAALGIDRVRVAARIRVAVLATGSELCAPGQVRAPQQIYDSNSSMAAGFFAGQSCEIVGRERVRDDPGALAMALNRLVGAADLIVTSGGIADGDEDHVRRVVEGIAAR